MREDPDSLSKDYSIRKASASYDPYNEEAYFYALMYEDDMKLKASMVIDFQQ